MMWLLLLFHLITCDVFTRGMYSDEVYYTLYGNITSFDDIINEAKDILNSTETVKNRTLSDGELFRKYGKKTNKFNFDEFKDEEETGDDHARDEFIKITKSFKNNNLTRRGLDYEDKDDADFGLHLELSKEQTIRKMILGYVMHCRHEIGKALRQRNEYIHDKRYKIGYLFNRIRRIKTEQVKLVWIVLNRQYGEPWFDSPLRDAVQFTLLVYEKIAAYDVDIRDICRFIKQLHQIEQESDYYYLAKQTATTK